MKAKKIVIPAILIIAVVSAAMFLVWRIFHRDAFEFQTSGSLYDNLSEFALDLSGDSDPLTQAYLEGIQYEITEIDREHMTATVDLRVPVVSQQLSAILDQVMEENSGADYDDLKQLAEDKLSHALTSGELETESSTMTLQIEYTDGAYKLVPSEEWNDTLTGPLETLYLSYLEALMGGLTDETPD